MAFTKGDEENQRYFRPSWCEVTTKSWRWVMAVGSFFNLL